MADSEEPSEQELQESARKLRMALDELFEHEFKFLSLDEQLEKFVVLISQYPQQVVSRAVMMTNDDSLRLPIHLACDKSAPTECIKWLLDSDTQKKSISVPDQWGDLPLHTCCSRVENAVELVRLLLESDVYKTTLFVKDKQGYLPLHMACRYLAPAQVVSLLLEHDKNKSSLFDKGLYEQLPLHMACRCNASPEVIRLLVQEDETRKSLLEMDNVGRLPIHLALLLKPSPNLETIKILLEGMICHRIENKGLQQWKMDIKSFCKSMMIHERDVDVRFKLDVIVKCLKAIMERATLLELAVWKASCLGYNDNGFQNMEDIIALGETIHEFDPEEYKKDAHIKSGADIIVRGVLSFLEDEPVAEVLDEIK